MADINVKDIDDEKMRKTLFIVKSKGTNLTQEIKKMFDKYAEEFDKQFQNKKGE